MVDDEVQDKVYAECLIYSDADLTSTDIGNLKFRIMQESNTDKRLDLTPKLKTFVKT